MPVRRETPGDVGAVRRVVAAAFGSGGTGEEPLEVRLLDRLRADPGWLPALSWVATDDEVVVGHVVCTRGRVDGTPALGLGPLAVTPPAQRSGVGSALVRAVLGAADASGETLVALLGDPGFYVRFGFRPGAEQGVTAPDPRWGRHFQVRTSGPAPTGRFVYAAPFAEL